MININQLEKNDLLLIVLVAAILTQVAVRFTALAFGYDLIGNIVSLILGLALFLTGCEWVERKRPDEYAYFNKFGYYIFSATFAGAGFLASLHHYLDK